MMYSVRCTNCGQLLNLKTDEIRQIVAEEEAAGHVHYQLDCPKCRRLVKIPIKQLKLRIPAGESTDTAEENTEQAVQATEQDDKPKAKKLAARKSSKATKTAKTE